MYYKIFQMKYNLVGEKKVHFYVFLARSVAYFVKFGAFSHIGNSLDVVALNQILLAATMFT